MDGPDAPAGEPETVDEPNDKPRRGRAAKATAEPERAGAAAEPARDLDSVEGVVELLANGSGFVRVHGPESSEDDVYISAAQVRRCELVSGDRVSGPVRTPRRSERYPSLVRVDTINGAPADSVAALRGQLSRLDAACTAADRDPATIDRILLTGFTPDRLDPFTSVDAFVDFAGRHAELGFDEIVVHWPIPDSDFAVDPGVFEQIATQAPGQLA